KIHVNKDSSILFKCTTNKCSASITVDTSNNMIRESGKHDHEVRMEEEIRNVIRGMKRKLQEDPSRPIPQVYEEERAIFGRAGGAVGKLPRLEGVKSTLYRTRLDQLPPLPKSADNLQIPPAMSKTLNDQQFLIYCSNQIVSYCSPFGISMLSQTFHWNADGTFQTCPQLFSQSYTIHAFDSYSMKPGLFSALP
ncbi:unnamed protein product, partial [Didymodactylos carnosus]